MGKLIFFCLLLGGNIAFSQTTQSQNELNALEKCFSELKTNYPEVNFIFNDIYDSQELDNTYDQEKQKVISFCDDQIKNKQNAIQQDTQLKMFQDGLKEWERVYKIASNNLQNGRLLVMATSRGEIKVISLENVKDSYGNPFSPDHITIEDFRSKKYINSMMDGVKLAKEHLQAEESSIKGWGDVKEAKLKILENKCNEIKNNWIIESKKLEDFVVKVKSLKISQSTKDDVVALLGQPTTDNQNSLSYDFKPEGLKWVSAYFTFDNLAKLSNVNITKNSKNGSLQVIYSKSSN